MADMKFTSQANLIKCKMLTAKKRRTDKHNISIKHSFYALRANSSPVKVVW